MKVWLDGEVVSSAQARVSVTDHGLTVGDGVFETMKVLDGVPFAFSRHLARLRTSAQTLGLPLPAEDTLRVGASELIRAHEPGELGRLRITVTGGKGPPGTDRGDAPPTVFMVGGALKSWPAAAVLATVPWARNERSAVAGAKTTSYAENVVALAWAKQRGAEEALFLDTRGHVCEGTGSNIFVVIDRQLFTPALSTGCLAGVTRGLVLEWCGGQEAELPVSVLTDASEVFVTSSTRDVQAVGVVDDRTYVAGGAITQSVAKEFARRSTLDIDP
jgi:branched-chain amino acid aminotransferase